MLLDTGELAGRGIEAVDGPIGEVREFYFDAREWALRYFVVDTSAWFDNRRVLVSTACFRNRNWNSGNVPVDLTRAQIRNSPDIDVTRPVSRPQEAQIVQYFGWPEYWHLGGAFSKHVVAAESDIATAVAEDPRVRSTAEFFGYAVRGIDGEVGNVAAFVVDTACWRIPYLVIDTGRWLPGKQVLLVPSLVEAVRWDNAQVQLGVPRRTVGNAPGYRAESLLTPDYEEEVHRHYGIPWPASLRDAEK